MSVGLHENGKVLAINLAGKLTADDYEHFIPEVERLIKQHGKLRILVQLHHFHGWGEGVLWQDIEFDPKDFRAVECVALVGEKAWMHGMVVFSKLFPAATIGYFEPSVAEEAEAWIHADLRSSKNERSQLRLTFGKRITSSSIPTR